MGVEFVVLIAGVALLASYFARRGGYSNNQRIVLSGIALGLMLWMFLRDGEPGKAILAVIGICILGSAAWYVLKTGKK